MSTPFDLRSTAVSCVELARLYATTQDKVGFNQAEFKLLSNALSYVLEGTTSDRRITGRMKLPLMERLILRAVVEAIEKADHDTLLRRRIIKLRSRAGATMDVTLPIGERK